jgi:NAD-dependent dihydropyrimidine dehydrogenase PreA subunit
MSKVFKQQTNRKTVGILNEGIPELIVHQPQKPSTYQLNGTTRVSSCVGCLNPMCMKFSPNELQVDDIRLAEFPMDSDYTVCPLAAIIWERDSQTPTIIPERCINCGICARRCPMGAIYSDGVTAVLHIGEKEISFAPAELEKTGKQAEQIAKLLACEHKGQYLTANEKSIGNLYDRLKEQDTEAQFPNLIVRNLFIVLGNQCIIRRRGDVYLRIDAIVTDRPSIGIAEVEFHKDSLESPRAILDDVAVLSSRYEIEKEEIKPFIVSLEFPNIRTEYWRVIKDIRDVLGIRIHSLTLGALCILAWSYMDILIGNVDFYADIDSPSIRENVSKQLLLEFPPLDSYAVLEPKK